MRRTLIALAAVAVLPGCTSEPPPPAPSTTSTSAPGSLADEWDEKLDAATQTPHPCGPTTARTPECADWLTGQADVVSALGAAIRAREDSSRYGRTLAGIVKVFQAREAYEDCADDCWNHALRINLGTLAVRTALRADETR